MARSGPDAASTYRVVSADAHILEPPHIWEQWLPTDLQDRAPKLAKDAAGGDGWLFAGATEPDPIGLTATPGMPWDQFRWTGVTYDEARAGCYDGAARLADMAGRRRRRRDPVPAAAHGRPLPRRRGRRLRPGRHRRLQRVPLGGVLRAGPHPAGRRGADAVDRHGRRRRLPAPRGRRAASRPWSCRTGRRATSSSDEADEPFWAAAAEAGPPGVHPHQRDLAGGPPAGPRSRGRGRRARAVRRQGRRRRTGRDAACRACSRWCRR